jgi:hypothetical protein
VTLLSYCSAVTYAEFTVTAGLLRGHLALRAAAITRQALAFHVGPQRGELASGAKCRVASCCQIPAGPALGLFDLG